jgi:hypothetical protein
MVDDAHWLYLAPAHKHGFARPTVSCPEQVPFVAAARTGIGDA